MSTTPLNRVQNRKASFFPVRLSIGGTINLLAVSRYHCCFREGQNAIIVAPITRDAAG